MHIIFDDHVEKVRDRFTVLELDSFCTPGSDRMIKAWCVIESVPLTEIPMLPYLQDLHQNLMREYGRQNWQFCLDALDQLFGKWNGEIDSFYADLHNRIREYKTHPPGPNWTATRLRASG